MISKTPLNDQVNAGAEDAPALLFSGGKDDFSALKTNQKSSLYFLFGNSVQPIIMDGNIS